MAQDYSILSTQPYTYLDKTGSVIQGYRVNFEIYGYGETHFVLVPTLAKPTVEAAITAVINDRKALGPVPK